MFKKKDFIDYFAIIIIFAASIAPYVLVNKSSDLFYFTEYEDRHAFLIPLSFALFFTILLNISQKIQWNVFDFYDISDFSILT